MEVRLILILVSSSQCIQTMGDIWFLLHHLDHFPVVELGLSLTIWRKGLLHHRRGIHSRTLVLRTWCFSKACPYLWNKMEVNQPTFHRWLLQRTTNRLLFHDPAFIRSLVKGTQQYHKDSWHPFNLEFHPLKVQSQSIWCNHQRPRVHSLV